jgi:hypothetical protein
MKIEFLIPGSPTDAFFSQVAMFRLDLDALGGIYERARLVLCLGAPRAAAVPVRWKPHLRRVDVLWAPETVYHATGTGSVFRYELLDASSDLSILCDADTLLARPFDPASLEDFVQRPAVRGVIAHYPPPLGDDAGRDYSPQGPDWFWQFIARRTLGTEIDFPHEYSLQVPGGRAPFYVNYGAVIGTFDLLRRLRDELAWLLPRIRADLANRFAGQIGLTLGCLAGGIPTEPLPMRYNFPNDPIADRLYPEELSQVVLLHYLRLERFDRQRIFTSEDDFKAFLALRLNGSDHVFQDRIRSITGGAYPFR